MRLPVLALFFSVFSTSALAAQEAWVSLGRIVQPNIVTFVSAAPRRVGARVELDQIAIYTDDGLQESAGRFRLSIDCAAPSVQVLAYEGLSRAPSRREPLGWWRASALVEALPRTDLSEAEQAIVRYACAGGETRTTYASFASAYDAVMARPGDF